MAENVLNWPAYMDKEQNRARILRRLEKNGPMRFTDLKKATGFSERGLTTMLKELKAQHKIEDTLLDSGKVAYKISGSGHAWLMKYTGLVSLVNLLRDEGAIYLEDHSNTKGTMYYYNLDWGIQDDMIVDKNLENENPITNETAYELQKLLYKLIKKDVKKDKVHLDNAKKGDIVLGFTIEYDKLVKSIQEQSLEYLDVVSEREEELLQKWEKGKITKREKEEFDKIRKETKEKLGGKES